MGPRVRGVVGEGLSGPRRQAGEAVVIRCVVDEIGGQFAPHDQFLKVGVPIGGFNGGLLLEGQGQVERRDLAEVQVRAHAGDVVGLGLVAVARVAAEPLVEKVLEALLGGLRAPGEKAAHRTDAAVDFKTLEQPRHPITDGQPLQVKP